MRFFLCIRKQQLTTATTHNKELTIRNRYTTRPKMKLQKALQAAGCRPQGAYLYLCLSSLRYYENEYLRVPVCHSKCRKIQVFPAMNSFTSAYLDWKGNITSVAIPKPPIIVTGVKLIIDRWCSVFGRLSKSTKTSFLRVDYCTRMYRSWVSMCTRTWHWHIYIVWWRVFW